MYIHVCVLYVCMYNNTCMYVFMCMMVYVCRVFVCSAEEEVMVVQTRADVVERWGHDLYMEADQGPRQQWEKDKVREREKERESERELKLLYRQTMISYPDHLSPNVDAFHIFLCKCCWGFVPYYIYLHCVFCLFHFRIRTTMRS